ncbi:MAG: hypothetical protein JWQ98_3327 [Chlorobi bacterium]|nr:hypothetical protein [Chlorobiota bacterium]
MNGSRVILVAILTVRRSHLDEFRAFERLAAGVMAKYGGAIERTVVADNPDDDGTVKEIHIVAFPDAGRLAMYRRDDELAPFLHLRAASVISTEILAGTDGPDYS